MKKGWWKSTKTFMIYSSWWFLLIQKEMVILHFIHMWLNNKTIAWCVLFTKILFFKSDIDSVDRMFTYFSQTQVHSSIILSCRKHFFSHSHAYYLNNKSFTIEYSNSLIYCTIPRIYWTAPVHLHEADCRRLLWCQILCSVHPQGNLQVHRFLCLLEIINSRNTDTYNTENKC